MRDPVEPDADAGQRTQLKDHHSRAVAGGFVEDEGTEEDGDQHVDHVHERHGERERRDLVGALVQCGGEDADTGQRDEQDEQPGLRRMAVRNAFPVSLRRPAVMPNRIPAAAPRRAAWCRGSRAARVRQPRSTPSATATPKTTRTTAVRGRTDSFDGAGFAHRRKTASPTTVIRTARTSARGGCDERDEHCRQPRRPPRQVTEHRPAPGGRWPGESRRLDAAVRSTSRTRPRTQVRRRPRRLPAVRWSTGAGL
jgi:hypothetical protein